MIPFPDRKYSIIYADPPWPYSHRTGESVAANHYPPMEMSDLLALPVRHITTPDARLFLWATWPMLPQALGIIEAWGFQYKTCGFLWAKQSSTGRTWHVGLGSYTLANTEPCLLGIREGLRARTNPAIRQLVIAPRGRHSEKPAEVRDRIVRLYGDVPRIELFARQRVPGWDCWGLEAPPE